MAAMTSTFTCYTVRATQEPLGDREGHSLEVAEICGCVDSGPLSGGIITIDGIYEWDKTTAVSISTHGVIRKPDAIAVYQVDDGKIALTVTDGKITGATGSGRGTYLLATGSAASLAGKSFTWSAKGKWFPPLCDGIQNGIA